MTQPAMKLAKPTFDIGLTVRDVKGSGAFWSERIGAVFDHVLPTGRMDQHRYDLNGSVLKLNDWADVADGPPSGYDRLLVAKPGLSELQPLADPEGNTVVLVPPGTDGVTQIGVVLRVNDLAAHRRFLAETLGFPQAGDNLFRVGDAAILLEHAPAPDRTAPPLVGPGYRYLTFQIFDARAAHAHYLANGGKANQSVQQMRDVARFVMVEDPDGNWIELSQRASLTGPLGD
jgi:lactoylglutathione lyase